MDDLATWLTAQVDTDERVALAASSGDNGVWCQSDPDNPGHILDERGFTVTHFEDGSPDANQATHIALNDPARVLAEVRAKRLLIDLHAACGSGSGYCDDGGHVQYGGVCFNLAVLTLPYADRPGYREEWRPAE
jgi:hypothetical protein